MSKREGNDYMDNKTYEKIEKLVDVERCWRFIDKVKNDILNSKRVNELLDISASDIEKVSDVLYEYATELQYEIEEQIGVK